MIALRTHPLFIANWKMNMLASQAEQYARDFLTLSDSAHESLAGLWFAPPVTALPSFKKIVGSRLTVGSQNVHWLDHGPHTGELSAAMLLEHGAEFSIVGHSERRQYYGETNRGVNQRAQALLDAGLTAVVCLGESKMDFEKNTSLKVVTDQLLGCLEGITAGRVRGNLVIAYEPVWAIGTGLSATPDFAAKVHRLIRDELSFLFGAELANTIPVIYGGSTTPENIVSLLQYPEIDGVLVGSASLSPKTFFDMVHEGHEAWRARPHHMSGNPS